MYERERGDCSSKFCGIKVSVYFNGKSHTKSFSFYDKKSNSYLEGEDRDPIRKLAQKEEQRLLSCKKDHLVQTSLSDFGIYIENDNSMKIKLGLPSGYIWGENKKRCLSLSIRGSHGLNLSLATDYDSFLVQWNLLAESNAKTLGIEELPDVWLNLRPSKSQWLDFLTKIIKFSNIQGYTSYSVKNEKLIKQSLKPTHFNTGYPGLTFRTSRLKRKEGGDILTSKIFVCTPRRLRKPGEKLKTRSFHVYNYVELQEIWPHAINAYCSFSHLKKTSDMLDAIPTEKEFINVLALGRQQYKGLLAEDPHPTQRSFGVGNKKPIHQI